MKFGRKAGTITQTSTGTSVGEWPRSLRDGETRVRFVMEIPEWIEYWEHYDENAKFFPCTGDKNSCPGCTSASERTAKASKRYLTTVLDPKNGRVYALKLPMDLANRLSLRNDRNGGTITNRDYTLIRSGKGLETEYDVEQEEKVPIDLSVYEDSIDLQDMLASQFAAAWPDVDPDNPNGNKRQTRARKQQDEEEEEQPRRRRSSPTVDSIRRSRPAAEEHEEEVNTKGENEPPPWETEAEMKQAESKESKPADDDDMVEITEDDLRNMPRAELVKVARQAGAQIKLTMNRDEIIDILLENFSS